MHSLENKSLIVLRLLCALAVIYACPASAKNVLDLQNKKLEEILDFTAGKGEKHGFVRLININPDINVWYMLALVWPDQEEIHYFHLENPFPRTAYFHLDTANKTGILIQTKESTTECPLWKEMGKSELLQARESKLTFSPLCDDKVFLRNKTEGKESTKEWATDFLRKHVWGGEQITSLVKDYLYKDKFLIAPKVETEKKDGEVASASSPHTPLPARLNPEHENKTMTPEQIGINLGEHKDLPLPVGQWVETKVNKHVFFSVLEPRFVHPEILTSNKDRVKDLDKVEASAAAYLVAFDLDKFNVGFSIGTIHPSLEWSDRTIDAQRDKTLKGPDGIDSYFPLIMTGKVNPLDAGNIIATFTGGFKRTHSAFKSGELSKNNAGSHYGFMENGVVFSRLNPNLASFIVYNDGEVEMKTWSDEDLKPTNLAKIRHIRQNGVPIIDQDNTTKKSFPGAFVGNWNLGNWSGSAESQQRALRAAICMQERNQKRFLIYGYFTSVTPNAIARVFEAYGCQYAMHLDMNALEHTYLALYEQMKNQFNIQHLITGMKVLDRIVSGQYVPRFVGTADNRDFFYIMNKDKK